MLIVLNPDPNWAKSWIRILIQIQCTYLDPQHWLVPVLQINFFTAETSVADPERFDADPDPTFQADADPDPAPDPNPFTWVKSSFIVSKVFQNFSCVISQQECGRKGEG